MNDNSASVTAETNAEMSWGNGGWEKHSAAGGYPSPVARISHVIASLPCEEGSAVDYRKT